MSYQTGPEELSSSEYSSSTERSRFPEQPSQRRLLRRSKVNNVVAGVCGGLGRYFDIEPVLFRIAFLVLLIPGGFGLLAYVIAWISMPEFKTREEEERDNLARPVGGQLVGTLFGGVLILIGVLILLERLIDWFDMRMIGAVILIAVGAIIVLRGLQREGTE